MESKLSRAIPAIVFGLLVASAAGSLLTYVLLTQHPAVEDRLVSNVTITIRTPGWTLNYTGVATSNNTVFGLLLESADRLDFEVRWLNYTLPEGVLVMSINGATNGGSGRFWQYWVDGVYGDRAADKKEIFDGDLVEWTFEVPQGGG